VEGVCQFILGTIGIISNLLAIPILCHKRMNTIFSKLLICLLVLHTVYLGCVLVMELMWPSWNDNPQRISESWFIFIFSYGLYPLKQLMHYSSTFFTTLMARQRFLAIRHPIEYRNSTLTINPWVSVMKSLSFVIVTGALFTFPYTWKPQWNMLKLIGSRSSIQLILNWYVISVVCFLGILNVSFLKHSITFMLVCVIFYL